MVAWVAVTGTVAVCARAPARRTEKRTAKEKILERMMFIAIIIVVSKDRWKDRLVSGCCVARCLVKNNECCESAEVTKGPKETPENKRKVTQTRPRSPHTFTRTRDTARAHGISDNFIQSHSRSLTHSRSPTPAKTRARENWWERAPWAGPGIFGLVHLLYVAGAFFLCSGLLKNKKIVAANRQIFARLLY